MYASAPKLLIINGVMYVDHICLVKQVIQPYAYGSYGGYGGYIISRDVAF